MKSNRETSAPAFEQDRGGESVGSRVEERPSVEQRAHVAASRHSAFLIRGATRAPSPDLTKSTEPLDPLPVRARVGTQPPSAALSELAAAVTRRRLEPLSATLGSPPPSPAQPSAIAAPVSVSVPAPAAVADSSEAFGAAGTTSFDAIPAFDFAVPSFAASATTLAVPISEIDNPGEQPFSVRVSVTWSGEGDGAVTVEIGRIVPPPGSTGTFLLPLPAAVRELLRKREGKLRLRLAVRTARPNPASPASQPLPPNWPAPQSPALHVKIIQPRWH